jgi:hypothetical protein
MADALPRTAPHAFDATIARHPFAYVVRLVIVAGCLLPIVAQADEPPALKPPVDRAELEPEEVARRFFFAVLTRDKSAIERYILPEEHCELLWKGSPVSEAARRSQANRRDEVQTPKARRHGHRRQWQRVQGRPAASERRARAAVA